MPEISRGLSTIFFLFILYFIYKPESTRDGKKKRMMICSLYISSFFFLRHFSVCILTVISVVMLILSTIPISSLSCLLYLVSLFFCSSFLHSQSLLVFPFSCSPLGCYIGPVSFFYNLSILPTRFTFLILVLSCFPSQRHLLSVFLSFINICMSPVCHCLSISAC